MDIGPVNEDPLWPGNAAIFTGQLALPTGYSNLNLNQSCGKFIFTFFQLLKKFISISFCIKNLINKSRINTCFFYI